MRRPDGRVAAVASPAGRVVLVALAAMLVVFALGCRVVGFDTPYNKGIEAYRAGELEEAAEQFRIAVRRAPDFHEAWYNLARVYDERAARLSVRAEEADADGRREEAQRLRELSTDALDKADEAYREAIEQNSRSARALISYGMFLYDHGEATLARTFLQRAAAAETDRAYPLTALGHYYQREGDWDQARRFYQRALDREPRHAMTHYRLATWHDEQGQYDLARDAYHEAIKLDRNDEAAWLRLGYVYARLDDPLRAADALERHLMLTRHAPTAFRARARVLLDIAELSMAAGRYEQAVEALWSARQHDATNPEVSELLQRAYSRLAHEETTRGRELRARADAQAAEDGGTRTSRSPDGIEAVEAWEREDLESADGASVD